MVGVLLYRLYSFERMFRKEGDKLSLSKRSRSKVEGFLRMLRNFCPLLSMGDLFSRYRLEKIGDWERLEIWACIQY